MDAYFLLAYINGRDSTWIIAYLPRFRTSNQSRQNGESKRASAIIIARQAQQTILAVSFNRLVLKPGLYDIFDCVALISNGKSNALPL